MSDPQSIEETQKSPINYPCVSTDIQSDFEVSRPLAKSSGEHPEGTSLGNTVGSLSTSVATDPLVLRVSHSDSAQVFRLVTPQRFRISLSDARRKALNSVERANRRRHMESDAGADGGM